MKKTCFGILLKLFCSFDVYFCKLLKMHTRLKKWMESEELKSSQLADNIGVNRATISHILSGRNKPSIDFFEKLLRVYARLNSNWLITGIGYMSTEKEVKEVKFSRKIGKVVVFYDDNSFDEVNS